MPHRPLPPCGRSYRDTDTPGLPTPAAHRICISAGKRHTGSCGIGFGGRSFRTRRHPGASFRYSFAARGNFVSNLSHAESLVVVSGRYFKHSKGADLGNIFDSLMNAILAPNSVSVIPKALGSVPPGRQMGLFDGRIPPTGTMACSCTLGRAPHRSGRFPPACPRHCRRYRTRSDGDRPELDRPFETEAPGNWTFPQVACANNELALDRAQRKKTDIFAIKQ